MKIKKKIAALLAIAMVLTSQSFSTPVLAEEAVSNETVEMQATNEETTIDLQTSTTEDKEEAAGTEAKTDEAVIATEETASESLEAEVSETTEEKADEAISEEVSEGKSDEEKTSDKEDVELTEDISDTDASAEGENTETLEASDEESLDAISDEEILIDDEEVEASSDYFTVDSNGVLQLLPGCSTRKTMNIPSNCLKIGDDIFKGDRTCTEIAFDDGSQLVEIAPGAFKGSAIQTITIPAGITAIQANVFENSDLKTLKFADETSITTIGSSAFKNCKIESITLSKCTDIGDNAFESCESLSTVSMKALERIGDNAFTNCKSLSDFIFYPALEVIGDFAFSNCAFEQIGLNELTKIESIASSDGNQRSTTIGNGVFQGNTKLITVYLANANATNITYIPDNMFSGCTKLKNVSIPTKNMTVGIQSFYGCTSLETIDLKETKYVKEKAFAGCANLKKITMKFKDEENEDNHVSIIFDAFPETSGVTMEGYDKNVENYAALRNYKFVSLYASKTVSLNAHYTKMNIVDGWNLYTTQKRRPGAIITILVSANAGYILKNISYMCENSSDEGELDYYGVNSSGDYIFRFTMPNDNVTVYAEGVPTASISAKNPTVMFDDKYNSSNNGESPTELNRGSYKWRSRGLKTKLKLKVDGVVFGNWMYNFSSDKPDVVSVDSEGVIVGVNRGSATITGVSKYNKNVKFSMPIYVEENIYIGQVYSGKNNLEKARKLIDAGEQGKVTIDSVTGYPIVTLDKNLFKTAGGSIEVDVEAYKWLNDNQKYKAEYNTEDNYMVETEWSSIDTAIATVAYAKRVNNHNTIKINKGANGETLIKISTKNINETVPNGAMIGSQNLETEDQWAEDNIAYIIVRVIDYTPRLAESKIVVNNQLKYGTPISIVPVYGYEISDDGENPIYIAKRKYNSATKEYYYDAEDAAASQFKVVQYNAEKYKDETEHYKDGYWYITTPGDVSLPVGNGKVKYTDLYICGLYKDSNLRDFRIPLTDFTLINQPLSPKISQSGSINLFYNYTADEGVAGNVTGKIRIKQSLTNNKVEKYKLVSAWNYGDPDDMPTEAMDFYPLEPERENKIGYGYSNMRIGDKIVPYDSLAYNFDIAVDSNSTNNSEAIITRSQSHKDIATINNKNVFSGYLYVYYKEYKNPVKVKLSIKTTNTAPSYKLSRTTITAFEGETGQMYPLYLYKAGSKTPEYDRVSLKYTYVETGDHIEDDDCYISYAYGTSATLDEKAIHKYYDDNKDIKHDYIRVKVPDDVSTNGKVIIQFRETTWSNPEKYLYYTLNIKTTNKLSAVLSAKKLTLNTAWVGGTDTQKITLTTSSPEDVEIVSISKVEYSYNAKNDKQKNGYETLASKILNNGKLDVEGNEIIIGQPATQAIADAIAPGSYTFRFYPKAKLKNADSYYEFAKPLSFTIAVVKKAPTISTTAVTLNTFAKNEKATATLKMANLINGTITAGYTVYDHTNDAYHNAPTDPKVTYTKSKTTPYYGYDDDATEYSSSFDYKIANYTYNTAKGLVEVTKGKSFTTTTAGTYLVQGVKMKSPGGAVANVANYKIAVKANTKKPSIKVTKTKGEINMVMKASVIDYTVQLKDVTGTIIGVKAFDIDSNGSGTKPVESRFYAEVDPLNDKLIHLYQRMEWDGTSSKSGWNKEEMVANKTYRVLLCFGVDSMNGFADNTDSKNADVSVEVKVKPVNKFPKMTVKSTRTYAYAGQSRLDEYGYETALTKNQWDIIVTAQLDKNYWGLDQLYNGETVNRVDIDDKTGVGWASNLAKSVKDEFTIVNDTMRYYPETGTIVFAVRLRNASEQLQNKQYTLKFVPKINEMQKKLPVDGNIFSINVDVRK